MLCDNCQEKEATIHVTQNINGVQSDMHLCTTCASSLQPFANPDLYKNFLPNIFSELMGHMIPQSVTQTPVEALAVCPKCGLSYADFTKYARLGCADCYEAFEPGLLKIYKNVQAGCIHQGKTPPHFSSLSSLLYAQKQPAEDMADAKRRLREEISRAVAVEDYEEAALLKKQLTALGECGHDDLV